jgi:hypothetical protein
MGSVKLGQWCGKANCLAQVGGWIGAGGHQGIQQIQSAGHDVGVVAGGITHRLAHVGEGDKVQHRLGGVIAQQLLHRRAIGQVGHNQRHLQRAFVDGAVAVAADVAGSAGDQNLHELQGEEDYQSLDLIQAGPCRYRIRG